jgi:hypothetical protein
MARFLNDLAAFLAQETPRPFTYGTTDCCSFTARWVERVTGTRPGRRHAFATERGMRRILRNRRGFARLVMEEMRGFARVHRPEPGDVALVRIGDGLLVGIVTPTGLAMKTDGGIIERMVPIVRCWRLA